MRKSRTMVIFNKFFFSSALVLLLTLHGHHLLINGLRTGAPQLACLSLRPLHGLHRPKPASASQFYLTQSSLSYLPADNITVEIETASSKERYFRGFIVQAYDPSTGAQVGRFLSTKESKPISGCSAATHRNNLNKNVITLTWIPGDRVSSQESDPWAAHMASQWLGLTRGGGLSSARSYQPSGVLISTGLRKRQLDSSSSASSPATSSPPTPRSVRFRATIVVTYEEFYSGFESTDQKFDKFDFAPTNKPQASA